MKTIMDYAKEIGNLTFKEYEFNEIDNVIFSVLSYIDFTGIIPTFNDGEIKLKDASEIYFKKHDAKEIKNNIIAVKSAIRLLKIISTTERYKNLDLCNYEYKVTNEMQFGAFCIKLSKNYMYVSYEGTDEFISGWHEDFKLSYKFPVAAQIEAINYLNKVVKLFGPKVYVGGHSKGGNLALVAAMYCGQLQSLKIKHVYSNDGPGLRKKEFESPEYKRILSKFTHIVPEQSMVGILLRNSNNYTVVKSTKKNIMQHDATTWVVEKNQLKRTKLSKYSIRLEKTMLNWLNNFNDEERENFVKILFSVLKKAGVNDLIELKKSKLSNIIKIIKETNNISKENMEMLNEYFKQLLTEWNNL